MLRSRLLALAAASALGAVLVAPAAAVVDPVMVVDGFEAPLDSATDADGNTVGWGTFQDPDSTITTSLATDATRPDAAEGNGVLELTTDVASFTGTTHYFGDDALTTWTPMDWSGFAGFALWVEGQGTGAGLFVDVLDNRNEGSTSDDAERWTVSFADDFTGWQLLEWTWDEFARKGVGNGAPDDGLGLTEVHGYALGATTTEGEVTWQFDDVQVFGERPLGVSFASPIITTSEDAGTVEVGVVLTRPAEQPISMVIATSDSTDRTSSEDLIATPDRDYVPTSAEVTVAPGATTASLTVELLDDDVVEVDETFQVVLEDVVGVPDPGPAGRTSVSIADDEQADPLLVTDVDEPSLPWLLETTGGATAEVREIADGDADAVPGQDAYEDVLDVTGPGAVVRPYQDAPDWSESQGLTMWVDGTGDGGEITVELWDDAAPDPGPEGWELAWSDEFEGAAGERANPDNWNYETGGWGWGNQELQYYTDSTDNAALDGEGNLVITTREVADPAAADLPCWYGPCTHTSARLNTEDKQEFLHGRIEARVLTGDGTGLWPAFWSLGNDFRDVGWPQTGEIDMMEYVGRLPGQVFGTIHGPGYSGGQSYSSGQVAIDPAPPEAFVEYAVEWEPEVIRWEVSGLQGSLEGELPYPAPQYHQAEPGDVPGEWVYEHPFFLLLNTALGGNFGGPLGDDLELPQETLVDWVRVWQAPDTAERFTATLTDDADGWYEVTIPWSAFSRGDDQPEGAPDNGLTLTEVNGIGVVLPDDATRSIAEIRLAEVPCADASAVNSAADDGEGSLRRALARTCSGGTVTVDASLADTTVGLASGELVASQDVVVDASDAPGFTVSGAGGSRVLRVEEGATVELRGVALVDGAGLGRGGAVLNSGDLTIVDGRVADSVETDAGGPAFDAGGGGIFTTDGARLHLLRTTVADNATTSHPGGGLHAMFDATVLVEDSTISGNTSPDVAGGIRVLGDLTMVDSTVSGNVAQVFSGGGIFATDGAVDLTNVTVGVNEAPQGGAGGIAAATFGDTGVTVTLRNSMVVGNTAGGALDCAVIQNGSGAVGFASQGGSLDSDGSCNLTEDSDQPGVDPLVGPLEDAGGPTMVHVPQDGSPAIDAALDDACDDADQRGEPRDDGACDVGSVEVQGPDEPDPDADTDGDGVTDVLEDAAGSDPDDAGSVPQCNGRDYTILGTLGDDLLRGTRGPDVIVALDGRDLVLGRGGDDVLCGGRGRDSVLGGNGDDLVDGGGGADRLVGGNGRDLVLGGGGADQALGGNGPDAVLGQGGDDDLYGGNGPDVVVGGAGEDRADGGRGRDLCSAETTRRCDGGGPSGPGRGRGPG